MKKILLSIIIFILFNSLNAISQNLDRLDNVNGFRKFKLGSLRSSYTNLKLDLGEIKLKNVADYYYTGKDLSDFSGVSIEHVFLSFYKNKLYGIRVDFGTPSKEYTSQQFDLVQNMLEVNFGNDYHKATESSVAEILNCNIWDASTVRLESLRLNLAEKDGNSNQQLNYITGYMLFIDKKLQLEQQQGEVEE